MENTAGAAARQNANTTEYDGLSNSVRPIHYNLSLFDLVFKEPWSFQGVVQIELEVVSPTDVITLHANEICVLDAEVTISRVGQTDSQIPATEMVYDAKNQRCALKFLQSLPLSTETKVVLSVRYLGIMNDHLTGFYRSAYQASSGMSTAAPEYGGSHYMFSTQFQPIDARRAFPCFDEPGLKATFDFEIEIPDTLTALSNLPIKVETRSSKKSGYKTVAFERSPRMSTYLLAWAVGEFEFIEKMITRQTGPAFPIRVYTTTGLKGNAEYGLDVGAKVVDYFSKMFDIEYPLPKLDMIVVHEMADDAMENWGLLTFQSTAMLFDPSTSAPSYKTHVAYIVAHELAHQWFGNLVTPYWWDELWLNEGFATWAGWDAVDHLHPEWDVWAEFVGDSMQSAFALDALQASHPVQVEVRSDLEVDSIFDAISYKKGSSLVRMLATYLGRENFVSGVSEYLKAHAYGSTKGEDLWRELSAVSGQDVASFMHAWISQKGFPVLDVDSTSSGMLTIRQRQFSSSNETGSTGAPTLWWTPLRPKYALTSAIETTSAEPLTVHESELEMSSAELLTLNAGQAGYYRLNVSPLLLTQLASRLNDLSVSEQVGFIGDLAALATAGYGSTTAGTLLSHLQLFRHQTNKHVWSAMLSSLDYIRSVFSSDSDIRASIDKYTLDLTSPILSKLEPNFFSLVHSSPAKLPDSLQGDLITAAGLAGHAEIITQAQTLTLRFLEGDESALAPSLRAAAFSISVNTTTVHQGSSNSPIASSSDFIKLLQQAYTATTTSLDLKEIILDSLGQVSTPASAHSLLEWTFNATSKAVETQHIPHIADGFASNSDPSVRYAVWEFVRDNWAIVLERLGESVVLLDRFLQVVLETLVVDEGTQLEIRRFFEGRDTTGFGRGVRVGLEMMEVNGSFRRKQEDILRKWLREKGYSG